MDAILSNTGPTTALKVVLERELNVRATEALVRQLREQSVSANLRPQNADVTRALGQQELQQVSWAFAWLGCSQPRALTAAF